MVWSRLSLYAAISTVVIATYPVQAADHRGEHGNGHHHPRGHRHHHLIIGGGEGVPVVIPGLGTFSGDISVLKIRGHGTYFYVDGLGNNEAEPMVPPPNAKVIRVGKDKSPCSYEEKVCVIRP